MEKLLFIVGPHAVGKTYTLKKIKQYKKFEIFDSGPTIRKIHQDKAPNIPLGDWIENLEEKYGEDITNILLCEEMDKLIETTDDATIVVIGFRSLEGISFIVNHYNNPDYELLYIDASIELLKENFEKRENINISIEDFSKYIQEEYENGLNDLKVWIELNPSIGSYICKDSNSDYFETEISNRILSPQYKEKIKGINEAANK